MPQRAAARGGDGATGWAAAARRGLAERHRAGRGTSAAKPPVGETGGEGCERERRPTACPTQTRCSRRIDHTNKCVCVCVCASVTSVCARRGGPPARSLGLDPGAARRGPAAPPGRGDLWPLHPSPPEQARRRARTLSAAARDVQPARTARSAAADRGTGRSGEPIIAAWGGVTPGRAARARRARPGPLGWMPSR